MGKEPTPVRHSDPDLDDIKTEYLRDEIGKCESLEEFIEEINPLFRTQKEQWKDKFSSILELSHLNKSEFAELCGVERPSVYKWLSGSLPKNRETFLRIGMAAGYGREEMNHLLQRYGRYPELYSKSLEDCVCIFVIGRNYGREAVKKYDEILQEIRREIQLEVMIQSDDISTQYVNCKLADIRNEEELEKFISENTAVFATSYHQLYTYIKMNIRANYSSFSGNVLQLANGQEWSSSLRQCVSAINQNKWYPNRNKIISLGLHLSMDHDQIDEMLELAHMEPLCGKNIFESVIMYILDDADMNNMLDQSQENYNEDELCRYARKVLEQFDIPEIKEFITELPEDDNE